MVYYYCEYCNKNINLSSKAPPVCKVCGNDLREYSLAYEEIRRRQKNRVGHCSQCNEMVYGVPIQIVISIINKKIPKSSIYKDPSNPYEVYRPDYDLKKLQSTLYYLQNIQKVFRYICPKCYNGLKTKQESIQKPEPKDIICEQCGFENKATFGFCTNCGTSLELPKMSLKKRSRYIPRDVMSAVWQRDDGKCVECGSREDLEFDHIIPFSKGGASTVDNVQILCKKCNLKKSDKI